MPDRWRCPDCGISTEDPRLHINGYAYVAKDGRIVEVEGCSAVGASR